MSYSMITLRFVAAWVTVNLFIAAAMFWIEVFDDEHDLHIGFPKPFKRWELVVWGHRLSPNLRRLARWFREPLFRRKP